MHKWLDFSLKNYLLAYINIILLSQEITFYIVIECLISIGILTESLWRILLLFLSLT